MLSNAGLYFGGWETFVDVVNDFCVDPQGLQGVNILVASYDSYGYEGSGFVLFEQFGELYEVYGSHCSCYGLEGQWEPEKVNITELKDRSARGGFDTEEVRQAVVEILSLIELVGDVEAALIALRLS